MHGNPGNPDGKKNPSDDPCNKAGNPIIYSTGNKIEPEIDFASASPMGLSLHRNYNNYWDGIGIFGRNWLSDYDYKLAFNTDSTSDACYPKPGGGCAAPPSNPTTIWAMRPDGLQIKYTYSATDGVWWEDKPSPISRIAKNADGTFTLYGEGHNVERYNTSGFVVSVASEQGVGWTFGYDSHNYLKTVTDAAGRVIHFNWTGDQLTSVVDVDNHTYSYTYLANRAGSGANLLATATRPDDTSPTTIGYYYEDARFPFGLTGKDFNGQRYSTFAYDAAGRATLSKHGAMDQYTFTYTDGAQGADTTLTVLETNPLGRKTTYVFVNGKISTTTGSGGAGCIGTYKEHTYDANGYDDQVEDFNGNITNYDYAANGQLQQVVEAFGTTAARTTQYEWDPDPTRNRLKSVTLVGDSKTAYAYDPTSQRLSSVTVTNLSANGVANQSRTTNYSYTTYANGNVEWMTVDGPLPGSGDAVTYHFYNTGDLASVRNGLGQVTSSYSTYNGLGEPGHVVGMNNAATDTTYDQQGRIANVRTYPNGVAADTAYHYSASGLASFVTTPDGVAEHFVYDDTRYLQAIWRKSDTSQEEEDYSYDPMGNPVASAVRSAVGSSQVICLHWTTTPDGGRFCDQHDQVWTPAGTVVRSTSRTYDGLGRPWTVDGHHGQSVKTTYDANDNPQKITDALGHATTLTYDAFDRVIKSVDAKKGVTQYSYDAADRLVKVIDPDKFQTNYTYDGFGQLLKQVSKDTGTTLFTYDANGLLQSMKRADGVKTTYSYDGLYRVTGITAGGMTQTLVYDTCTNGLGLLCGYTDAFGASSTDQLTNAYTPEGWLASQTYTIAATSYTTRYRQDNMGRTTDLTYPNGVVAHYGYQDGKTVSVTATVNGTTVPVASTISHEPFGPASAWTVGNGLVTTRPIDDDGRPLGAGVVSTGGNVVQSLTLGYGDPADHITGITNGAVSAQTQAFKYDELDRLTNVTGTAVGTWSWQYDAATNRTSGGTPTGTATYGLTNNLLMSLSGPGAASRSFTYDANGNRKTDTGSNGTLGFHYDPFNRMDSATVNGTTTAYHVDPLGQRIYKAGTSSWTHFVYGGGNTLLAETGNAGATDYIYFGGMPIALVRNGQVDYIHGDQLGRPEVVTNAAQQVVWRASNRPFDRTILQDGIGGLNLGFPGQYYDAETGLWNNGFRDYDASVGRYVESDPLGLGGGTNTFAYVSGSPTSGADPSGLCDDKNKCEQPSKSNAVGKAGVEAWLCFAMQKQNKDKTAAPDWTLMNQRKVPANRGDQNLVAAERYAEMWAGNYSYYSPFNEGDFAYYDAYLKKARTIPYIGPLFGRNGGSPNYAWMFAQWGDRGARDFAAHKPFGGDNISCDCGN